MALKDNFTQAVKGLTGYDGPVEKTEPKDNHHIADTGIIKPADVIVVNKEQQNYSSIITKSMSITGNIQSSNELQVYGSVKGDIVSDRSVMVNGLVLGNIKAKQLTAKASMIKGDINLTGDAVFEAESVIVGNLNTDNLELSGKIKGNIDAKGVAQFNPSALMQGDLKASHMSAALGSKINGRIITDEVEDADFERALDFEIEE